MSCSMLGANQRVHEQCSSRAGTMRCPREVGLGFGLCKLASSKEMGQMKDEITEQNRPGAGQVFPGSPSAGKEEKLAPSLWFSLPLYSSVKLRLSP